MNLGNLMQLKNSWATFTQNHPKFPKFLQAAGYCCQRRHTDRNQDHNR